MLDKMKRLFAQVDMTEGKPWEKIVVFTIPMLIGNIAQQLYNTVDSIVVGKYVGDNALAAVGSAIAWIFAPLGWTQGGEGWKMAVAAITGLIAKENVVATFGILYGFAEVAEDGAEVWGNLASVMTPIAAYGFLVFNLLCAPCFAAMGAIKREMNNTKWFLFAIGYQCSLAYVVSMMIYQFGTFLTGGGFGLGTIVAVILLAIMLYLLFRPMKNAKKDTVLGVQSAA